MTAPQPYRPLTGIRVLDLSRLLPGPYGTMLLADMGAEVVKIETPRVGDYARFLPPEMGLGMMFETLNRNKKSVALNYRNPRGRELFLGLAQRADVVLESFRPGAVTRWGIGYEAVRAINPRIVYCSLSGYGQSGPYRDRAGHDLNYIAIGGLLNLNGAEGGPPIPPGVEIADLAGGMLAATAILGALVGRQSSGEGAFLDVAMLDAVVSWVAPTTTANAQRGRLALSGEFPCFNVYEAADGKFLTLAALEPDFWRAFCAAVERNDLLARQFDHAAIPEIAAIFRQRSREKWLTLLGEKDACVEAVNSLEEMQRHPQVLHRRLVETDGAHMGSPLRFTAGRPSNPPPGLGEHTSEFLSEIGLSASELSELEARGVVKAHYES
jgi:crotonobetainyl-CoA:carnitine CoA-transferase CaiB-like acyl-CoA transferase